MPELYFRKGKSKIKSRVGTLLYNILYSKIKKSIFIFTIFLCLFIIGILFEKTYSHIFVLYEKYAITAEQRTWEIEPSQPVYIKFNLPVSKAKVEKSFSIMPKTPGKITWQGEFIKGFATTFVFTPKEYFETSRTYKMEFAEIESFFGTKIKNASYEFKTITPPKILKIDWGDDQNKVRVDPKFEIFFNKQSSYYKFDFELNPPTQLKTYFDKENLKYTLIPKTKLSQGLDYTLTIRRYYRLNPSLEFKNIDQEIKYNFRSVNPVEVISFEPEDNRKDVENYEEIKIKFDRPVVYQSAEEHFSIQPEVEGTIGWEDHTLIFDPKKFTPGQKYTVNITQGIKAYEDTGVFEKNLSFSFTIKINPHEVVPSYKIVPQIKEGKYIDIDISDQMLTMFEDQISLGSYLVSTGTYDMPTPLGTFKILSKAELSYSSLYDLYMPYWMQFTSAGHGIHELPFWKYRGGYEYKERESHLGTRVSHGCVRLGVGPAETVYKWAEIGTPVVVHE